MKKILALTLALLMLLAVAACGKKAEANIVHVGVLTDIVENGGACSIGDHLHEQHSYYGAEDKKTNENSTLEVTQYHNLSTMLLDLKSDKLRSFGLNTETAKYIVARDNTLTYSEIPLQQVAYSMVTMEHNTELYDHLNGAIVALKADGTIDELTKTYLTGAAGDPAPAEIPVTEGAPTYKIAVTGDLPPMDFVSEDGKPAGFNVALLSEIAKHAGINLELVVIESGAKATALATGAVDAYFWIASGRCTEHPDFRESEPTGNVRLTEDYAVIGLSYVFKK